MSATEASLVNVYDEEYKQIEKLGVNIQSRWREVGRTIDIANSKETAKKCNEFAKWVEGEFEKLGFIALVDTTPIYADRPPTISLVSRMEDHEFDHEKKKREVEKSRERGGI